MHSHCTCACLYLNCSLKFHALQCTHSYLSWNEKNQYVYNEACVCVKPAAAFSVSFRTCTVYSWI